MEANFKRERYISWSAILAAAIIGVGLNFLLNLLSLGLGISSFSISVQGETRFSLAGFFCFCLSAMISMFSTGWIAGRLSPCVLSQRWGAFYGFLAWCLLLIFTIILITNMIQYSAFHSNFTSNLVAIKLTNNAPMLTQTAADIQQNTPLSINIETNKKVLTLNALLTFILFALGACASVIGGILGYRKPPSPFKKNNQT
ncbi:hypothetical protein EAW55_04590 [Legionella jordanis]|uniref:Transmembrane protein n=1 Tax=Legionella jordanis TaxID=456 RepID=A0A0W0V7D4_9GAMM|nr:hypothetical protein [Legionella jordanis]KTD16049.1 hypothetical protein Ljor_0355 [Legionella jordanis]RMX04718.1 hypothetical protein EAW55_04590 [Legionella jordanis]RMX18427.1 hypothetical protein EAS68_08775 [Legionella jordanis]VEH12492.1 Uncharacterised protein [Legionella jordanis]